MPILLKTIRIAGFRAHKNIEVDLGRQTILIGTNNVGKTTLLNAVQLALGDGRSSLTQDDFYIQNGNACSNLIVDLLFLPADAEGKLVEDFDSIWTAALGKGIKEGDSRQFFAFRTRVSSDEKDKSLVPSRNILNQWLAWDESEAWQNSSNEGEAFSISSITKCIRLFFQNAQCDILDDIRQRSSYLGRALSKISYDQSDRELLEDMIQEVNDKAVHLSPILGILKNNLSQLGNTFGSTQGSADITPFAKNIRDLTKSVRLHFHDGNENFSMEYHGMGTRSWASLLTLKAYVQILAEEASRNQKAFYPILALEEPEAHLHPNAQKQIMGQIKGFPGQIIVSTHSPHVASQAAEADLSVIRCLYKSLGIVKVGSVPSGLDSEFLRQVQRQIVQTRGELLFSRAWLLFEGETEALAFPLFFERYFGKSPYDLGIDLIGCNGGGNYAPFIRVAHELNIPWYIFSDGEAKIVASLNSFIREHSGFAEGIENHPRVFILPGGMDYESYLLNSEYQDSCKNAIDAVERAGFVDQKINQMHGKKKRQIQTNVKCESCQQYIYEGEIRDYSGEDKYKKYISDLLDDSKNKTKYAKAIAEQILILPAPRDIPPVIRELFLKIKSDLFPGEIP